MDAFIDRKQRNKASAAKSRAQRKIEKEALNALVEKLKIENAQLRAYIHALRVTQYFQSTEVATSFEQGLKESEENKFFIINPTEENHLHSTKSIIFDAAGMDDLSDFTVTALSPTPFFEKEPPAFALM